MLSACGAPAPPVEAVPEESKPFDVVLSGGRYVRDPGGLTLEEAVRKMTSMPADQYNQPQRGRADGGASRHVDTRTRPSRPGEH